MAQLRKVYGSVGVVFKGSGFYRTDSRAAATSTAPSNGSGDKPAGGEKSGRQGREEGGRSDRFRRIVAIRPAGRSRPAPAAARQAVARQAARRPAARPALAARPVAARPPRAEPALGPAEAGPGSAAAILDLMVAPSVTIRSGFPVRRRADGAVLARCSASASPRWHLRSPAPSSGPAVRPGQHHDLAARPTTTAIPLPSPAADHHGSPGHGAASAADDRAAPAAELTVSTRHHRPRGALGAGLPAGRHGAGLRTATTARSARSPRARRARRTTDRHHRRGRARRRGRPARARGVARSSPRTVCSTCTTRPPTDNRIDDRHAAGRRARPIKR